ncbi:hypothetical protein SAMN05444162_0139 [Paenibacillaceae bacterium GAS479]|nr:hypothetical protein SAMN05444162_0139 [Paenibacillaceae bacterium GAS479]
MSKPKKQTLEVQAMLALERLRNELDKPEGFSEYAQFCEEALQTLIPCLNEKGLEYLRVKALTNCQLPEGSDHE